MKNTLLGLLLFISSSLHAQSLESYYFNSNLNGTGGAPTLAEVFTCTGSSGSFSTDSIFTTNGFCSYSTFFCFTQGGGLLYPNASITGTYSINLFFTFDYLGSWSRIIDFSNGTEDDGIYLLNDCLNFYPNGNVGTCPYFFSELYYLYTFVRDGNTDTISVFVNGTLFSQYYDAGNLYRPANNTTPIIFFGDDVVVPCEVKPGCIKYASISSNVLSADDVDSIWQNICKISLPPCDVFISYDGNPYSTDLTSPQDVTLTGPLGGVFTSTAGLELDSLTGAVLPSASTPGTYIVTYAVSVPQVCTESVVSAEVIIYSPSGVQQISTNDFTIYPNPVENGWLTIEAGTEWLGTEFELFNQLGQSVYRIEINNQRMAVHLNEAHGIYYVRLNSKEHSEVRQIVFL